MDVTHCDYKRYSIEMNRWLQCKKAAFFDRRGAERVRVCKAENEL